MDDSEAQFALCQYSRTLWEDLADRLPASVEFDPTGTLWVAADDEEMAEVGRKKMFFDDRGLEARVVDARELAAIEPNLRRGLVGGLVVPGDRVIYPPCAAKWLLDQAVGRGRRSDSASRSTPSMPQASGSSTASGSRPMRSSTRRGFARRP